ncbi:conserved hypothetical protein [Culex quinquefasciatus]|uniref:Uncharacterized protein n=1 Tax=Culex quinquefasciatus TaxID=7176 RepID=B0WZQ5_CULQU|nr:conserved hypothetical protein [Culex quinquefasciatus]|eukprot:XP_001862877.1 conserved hypothetical protein [Culex quinquefasciatus]
MSSTGIVSKRFSKAKMKILPRWRICTIGKRPSSSDREQTSARFKDQLITSVTKEYGGVDETEKKESKTTAAVGLQEFGGDTDDVFSSLSKQQASFTSFRRTLWTVAVDSSSKHPVVSMEPNSDGGLEYAQSTARRRPLRADPTEVPLNFFESEQERWFQHVTIENVIKERMTMGPGDVAGPSNNATINSCGIDKAMAVYTEIRSKQYYKFWTRKIARKLRILVLQVIDSPVEDLAQGSPDRLWQSVGGDRQFDQSTRGQRAYPDSDEEPCGIDSRELVEIIQPPVTPFLLDVQSDVGDKFTEGGIIGNLSLRTALVMLNSAIVKPVKKVLYNQPELALRPWTAVGLEEFKQLCLRLSYDQQARIMKATLTDVEKKGQLAEVTLLNVVCDLKQVDVNYWPHIPQGKSIVRITFVLDAVTLTVCPNVYSKLLLTILPEVVGAHNMGNGSDEHLQMFNIDDSADDTLSECVGGIYPTDTSRGTIDNYEMG